MDMMEITQTPTRTELVRRASEIVPILQANANWNEEHRRLHDESVDAMAQAGIFKLRVPKRYGGYECDVHTVVEVLAQIGRGDGSASWTAGIWSSSAWLVGLFPDAVQDEVFSNPDVRVCAILSPTATAVRKDGGVVVNGQWRFNSGSLHSQWDVLNAISTTPEGVPEPIIVLIPMSELEVLDDWDTAGLRGTGSVTTVAKEVFVPQERVLSLAPLLQGQYASKLNADTPLYRSPVIPTSVTIASATSLGLAKAAMDAFFQRLPGRHITYTTYAKQTEAPLTHLQVAEAAMKIDEAEFHAYHAAALLDTKAASGEAWTVEERCRVRLDAAWVGRLAKEAVDILNTASGASSIYSTVPIQRIERDIQTLNLHALLHPNTNLELYGRVRCGLEPNSVYL